MTVPAEPLLFVHAHPDDETLTAGLTMAHHVRAGHPVHVLTCTLGEEGEVIPPELPHLDAAHDDALGALPPRRAPGRHGRRSGVTHEVLGDDAGAGALSRYRDSGMAGTPSAANPAAFVNADLAEAADAGRRRSCAGSVRPPSSPTTSRAATATPTTSRRTASPAPPSRSLPAGRATARCMPC